MPSHGNAPADHGRTVSFDVAATAYDRYMGAWSRLLAPQLADLAGVRAGATVLDVGCGPGSLTSELVRRVGADNVSAVDPSGTFVAAARDRHPGVDVRQARAEALPFADATFDAALAQLVVHFMADPEAGLREMARVVRAGGTVAACVWDYAGGRGPLGPFWPVARTMEPDVGDESELAGTRDGHLATLLASAGVADVEQTSLSVTRAYDDFDTWWEPFTHGVGPGGAFVARLAPERQELVRERCRAALPAGPFSLTAHAWAAFGIVPRRPA